MNNPPEAEIPKPNAVNKLFRAEVYATDLVDIFGPPQMNGGMPSMWWAALALATLAAITILLFVGEFTRRETVHGLLVPSAGLVHVNVQTNGVLDRIYVRVGQSVNANAPIAQLSSGRSSAGLGDTSALIGMQLQKQRSRLLENVADHGRLARQQIISLRTRIALLQEQLPNLEEQSRLQTLQVDSHKALQHRVESLKAQGFASEAQLHQQRTATLDAESMLKSLGRQRLEVESQVAALRQDLMRLPIDVHAKVNDTERELAQIDQSVAENEQQLHSVIRAPAAGVIANLMPRIGQTVSSGDPLFSLVPQGTLLVAELYVPSRAIGLIEPGSRVAIRYQAFPYQKFGQQYGTVREASRSALSTREFNALTGHDPVEPMYRVEVTLQRQSISTKSKSENLKPGMALDADILLEKRRIVEWIFEPLFGLANRVRNDATNPVKDQ